MGYNSFLQIRFVREKYSQERAFVPANPAMTPAKRSAPSAEDTNECIRAIETTGCVWLGMPAAREHGDDEPTQRVRGMLAQSPVGRQQYQRSSRRFGTPLHSSEEKSAADVENACFGGYYHKSAPQVPVAIVALETFSTKKTKQNLLWRTWNCVERAGSALGVQIIRETATCSTMSSAFPPPRHKSHRRSRRYAQEKPYVHVTGERSPADVSTS